MQCDFLQLVIFSPLIHAFGDLSKASTGIQTQLERQTTYQLSYSSPQDILLVAMEYSNSNAIYLTSNFTICKTQDQSFYQVTPLRHYNCL